MQGEGETSSLDWALDIGQRRPQQFFEQFAAYVRSQCGSLLSTTPNACRITSYWDAQVQGTEGEGQGSIQVQLHAPAVEMKKHQLRKSHATCKAVVLHFSATSVLAFLFFR